MKLKRWIKAGVPFMALLLASPGAQAADLSLQEAINLALTQNTGLKVTQKGEDTAKYALEKARGSNGVSVGLSDTLSTTKNKDSDRQDSNSVGITGKLPLYTGGKNQASIKSAKIGVESASLQTQRAQEDLKLNVIKAYYNALEAQKTVGVRQETGKQAKVINNMILLFESMGRGELTPDEALKEFVGHTGRQVTVGALLGILTAVLMHLVLP